MRSQHHRWKRMRSRTAVVPIFELLTVLLMATVCATPARADVALLSYLTEGAAVHNGTHICMPEAQVRVNITRTSSGMLTSVSAEFHVSTNMTQNVTLAFVPPKISTTSGDPFYSHLSIALNSSEVEYMVLGWEDLGVEHGFATEIMDALGTWLEDAEYDVFSIELEGNSTATISVTSSTTQELTVERVGYNYFIASARTFEGDTHECVHMQLIEETPFLSVQFLPDSYLTLTEDGTRTDAIWDFNVSDFEDVSVRMLATVREHQGVWPPINLGWIIISAGVIAATAITVFLYRRR